MRIVALAALAVIAVAAAGCTTVEPWQRGVLAKPHMALQPNPALGALRAHTFTSREAASGVDPAEGGGCGCS